MQNTECFLSACVHSGSFITNKQGFSLAMGSRHDIFPRDKDVDSCVSISGMDAIAK